MELSFASVWGILEPSPGSPLQCLKNATAQEGRMCERILKRKVSEFLDQKGQREFHSKTCSVNKWKNHPSGKNCSDLSCQVVQLRSLQSSFRTYFTVLVLDLGQAESEQNKNMVFERYVLVLKGRAMVMCAWKNKQVQGKGLRNQI